MAGTRTKNGDQGQSRSGLPGVTPGENRKLKGAANRRQRQRRRDSKRTVIDVITDAIGGKR